MSPRSINVATRQWNSRKKTSRDVQSSDFRGMTGSERDAYYHAHIRIVPRSLYTSATSHNRIRWYMREWRYRYKFPSHHGALGPHSVLKYPGMILLYVFRHWSPRWTRHIYLMRCREWAAPVTTRMGRTNHQRFHWVTSWPYSSGAK